VNDVQLALTGGKVAAVGRGAGRSSRSCPTRTAGAGGVEGPPDRALATGVARLPDGWKTPRVVPGRDSNQTIPGWTKPSIAPEAISTQIDG